MFACRIGERREIDRRGRGEQARGVSPLACPPRPLRSVPRYTNSQTCICRRRGGGENGREGWGRGVWVGGGGEGWVEGLGGGGWKGWGEGGKYLTKRVKPQRGSIIMKNPRPVPTPDPI